MENTDSLALRLESYLAHLGDLNRRWSEWLAGNERAVLQGEIGSLHSLEPQAQGLISDLKSMLGVRRQMLDDAQSLGFPHRDLQSLAMHLSCAQGTNLVHGVAVARRHLAHVCRLQVATWVLVSQSMAYCAGGLQLMMAGHAQPHVYNAQPQSDTLGGKLLDTSL